MAIDAISDLHARWLPVADAAAVLGISDEMLRLRMSRQDIDTRVDADGRVSVRVPYDLTDYVRAGVTAPVAPGPADTIANGNTAAPAPSSPTASDPIDRLNALYEARISDLRQVHAARIADLKAVIVELADRHGAEIERMMESHGEELQRLVGLHNTGTHNLHEQAERTAKLEADNKAMLIEIILALKGRN